MLLNSLMHFENKVGSEILLCGVATPKAKKICFSEVFFRTPRISLLWQGLSCRQRGGGLHQRQKKNHTYSWAGGGFLKLGLPRAPSSTPSYEHFEDLWWRLEAIFFKGQWIDMLFRQLQQINSKPIKYFFYVLWKSLKKGFHQLAMGFVTLKSGTWRRGSDTISCR